jgi:MFS family permease
LAVVLFGVGWGANQFSSLLGSYRSALGLSESTTALLFGIYALGLVPGLLLGGPAADRWGRGRVLLPAALASAAATVLIIAGFWVQATLFAGRFMAGVATGGVLAAGTAWMKELSSAPYDPDARPSAGAQRAGLAISAGFGCGPLFAAVIAQWVPLPLVTAYLPHLAIMMVALPLVSGLPETVPPRSGRMPLRVRSAAGPEFTRVVAPLAPWVFAAASVALAVLPGVVAPSIGRLGTLFAGITAGVTLGCGVLVQPSARRLGRRSPLTVAGVGLLAVAAGMALSAVVTVTQSPALVLLAAAVLGSGYGLCLVFGLTEVARIADRGELAGLTAVFYALTYVGFAAPYVIALLTLVTRREYVLLGAAVLALLTLSAMARAWLRDPLDRKRRAS